MEFAIRLVDDRIKMAFDEESGIVTVTQNITEGVRLKYDVYENTDDGTIFFINRITGEIEHEFEPCKHK